MHAESSRKKRTAQWKGYAVVFFPSCSVLFCLTIAIKRVEDAHCISLIILLNVCLLACPFLLHELCHSHVSYGNHLSLNTGNWVFFLSNALARVWHFKLTNRMCVPAFHQIYKMNEWMNDAMHIRMTKAIQLMTRSFCKHGPLYSHTIKLWMERCIKV